MPLPLALLLAAGAVPELPPVGDLSESTGPWFRNDRDYPKSLHGHSGSVSIRLLFGPDGAFDKCSIVRSTGNAEMEQRVCAIARERMHVDPAVGLGHKPLYRLFPLYVSFRGNRDRGDVLPGPPIDYILEVDRLPANAQALSVRLDVEVAADGALIACGVPRAQVENRDYAAAACGALPGAWRPMVETTLAGEPVAHVRRLNIAFVRAEPAPASAP